MSHHREPEMEFSEYPEEEREILQPEIEEPAEEEAALPAPSEVDPLQRYIREANRFALLTPEEEKTLTLHYHETGDKVAAHR